MRTTQPIERAFGASAAASASIAAHRVFPQRTPHATTRRDACRAMDRDLAGVGRVPEHVEERRLLNSTAPGVRGRSSPPSRRASMSSVSYSRLMIVAMSIRSLAWLAADDPLLLDRASSARTAW